MLWLLLAGGVLALAFVGFRDVGGRNGLDALRELSERHQALSRAIGFERVRAKTLTGTELDLVTARLVQMEQQRRQLGDNIQRYQVALTRRGFGVNHFWLPTIEEFEKEAVARQSATTDGSKAS